MALMDTFSDMALVISKNEQNPGNEDAWCLHWRVNQTTRLGQLERQDDFGTVVHCPPEMLPDGHNY